MYKINLKFSVNAPTILTCLLKQENWQRIFHFIDALTEAKLLINFIYVIQFCSKFLTDFYGLGNDDL